MANTWLKKRRSIWWIFYARHIGRRPESLGTDRKDLAEAYQRKVEEEIWCGFHGIRPQMTQRIHYSEVLKAYAPQKQAAGLDPKTITNYLKTLNQFGEFLGSDVLLHQITVEKIEPFVSHRRKTPKQHGEGTLTPKSIRNEVFTITNFFSFAKKRGLIVENPCDGLARPRRVTYDAPRYLTFDEYVKLQENITNPHFATYCDFYLLTGIRRSDGLKVTSDNFDFERMMVVLPQHKQKNAKTLPISADLLRVAKRLIARAGPGKPLIQMHESRLTTNFAIARDKAGLPKSITFHSLRHTFASWLAAAGVDMRTVQELIGHRDAASTAIYVHPLEANMRRAVEKLTLPRKVAVGYWRVP